MAEGVYKCERFELTWGWNRQSKSVWHVSVGTTETVARSETDLRSEKAATF